MGSILALGFTTVISFFATLSIVREGKGPLIGDTLWPAGVSASFGWTVVSSMRFQSRFPQRLNVAALTCKSSNASSRLFPFNSMTSAA